MDESKERDNRIERRRWEGHGGQHSTTAPTDSLRCGDRPPVIAVMACRYELAASLWREGDQVLQTAQRALLRRLRPAHMLPVKDSAQTKTRHMELMKFFVSIGRVSINR